MGANVPGSPGNEDGALAGGRRVQMVHRHDFRGCQGLRARTYSRLWTYFRVSAMYVVVLLSSYQGERFIAQQLESILAQLPPEGRILVRDDGSSDGTVDRIAALNDPRISVTRGENVGFVRSFLLLLESAPDDADVIMLSDQDDVWLPGKIERACQHLTGRETIPTLYCSRLYLVDTDLKPLGLSPAWPRTPSFLNALAQNIVTGCTAALNQSARRLILRYGEPQLIAFHDWWFYLVIAAFGTVVVDDEPTVMYRQHGGNAIGMGAGIGRYLVILRFLSEKSWVRRMYAQIDNFRAVHADDLTPEQKRTLDRLFDPRKKMSILRLITYPHLCRQTAFDEVLFRGLVAVEMISGRGAVPMHVTK